MGRGKVLGALLAAAVVLGVTSAQAEPGALDPSFGSGGKVIAGTAAENEYGNAVAVQPDRKVVVAGETCTRPAPEVCRVLVARYNRDGSPDVGFGSGGTVKTAVGSVEDLANAVVLQADGKIVVAGSTRDGAREQFLLVRYNRDGSLDTGFGPNGAVMTPFRSERDGAMDVAVQPNGRIVAAGYSREGTNSRIAVVRYNADGSLDPSFGKVTTGLSAASAQANALVLQGGKIVVAGSGYGARSTFLLARYNADGSLDETFGSLGTVFTPISTDSAAGDVALQPDGKIVAAGSAGRSPLPGDPGVPYGFAIARYDANGHPDPAFGDGVGTSRVTFSGEYADAFGNTMVLQPNGKIVVGGVLSPGRGFALARVNPNGSLDASFGAGAGEGGEGKVTTLLGDYSYLYDLALQPDGKLVAAGSATVGMNDEVALARYEGDSNALRLVKRGKGKGTVASNPAGIECGRACAAAFASDSTVTLSAKASRGSRFAGWRGACSGKGRCTLTMGGDRSVTATFQRVCLVPRVTGMRLAKARAALVRAGCSLGRVKRSFSAKVPRGRVVSQASRPGTTRPARARVKLVVSKGKR